MYAEEDEEQDQDEAEICKPEDDDSSNDLVEVEVAADGNEEEGDFADPNNSHNVCESEPSSAIDNDHLYSSQLEVSICFL